MRCERIALPAEPYPHGRDYFSTARRRCQTILISCGNFWDENAKEGILSGMAAEEMRGLTPPGDML